MLAVNNLSFSHGENVLFQDINLYLMPGQTSILFGKNGSGKSTLLDCLLLTHQANTGSISYSGICVHFNTETQDNKLPFPISYLPQKITLWENMTCLENILFSIKDISYDQHYLDYLTEKFSIVHILSRYPHEISLGQKQIIGFIRAIMIDSPCIFLDEPTSALDKTNFGHMMDIIVAQKLTGKTILIVTHDTLVADKIGDKIYVLEHETITKVPSIGEYFS